MSAYTCMWCTCSLVMWFCNGFEFMQRIGICSTSLTCEICNIPTHCFATHTET